MECPAAAAPGPEARRVGGMSIRTALVGLVPLVAVVVAVVAVTRWSHHRQTAREQAARAGIAVADGIREEPAVGPQEREVDPPGVDADARHAAAVTGTGQTQADEHLLPEADGIPHQLAAVRHRGILEAVDLLEFEEPSVEGPGDDASSRRPQIDRQCHAACHQPLLAVPAHSAAVVAADRRRGIVDPRPHGGEARPFPPEAGQSRRTLRLSDRLFPPSLSPRRYSPEGEDPD